MGPIPCAGNRTKGLMMAIKRKPPDRNVSPCARKGLSRRRRGPLPPFYNLGTRRWESYSPPK
jgi:hypothetical protein